MSHDEHFDDYLGALSQEERDQLLKVLKAKKEETPRSTVKEDFTVERDGKGKKGRRRPVKAKKNLWEDTGELRDVKTPEFSKTPRSRQKASKVSVECHVCGKTFKIIPSLIYGEFIRCNRCTGR